MAAAIHSLNQGLERSCSLAYYYTKAMDAHSMCTVGLGITSDEEVGGVMVSKLSPADLNWEKDAKGEFKTTLGRKCGTHVVKTHGSTMQAVIILKIPTTHIPSESPDNYLIPMDLLEENAKERYWYYPNAHILKNYVLEESHKEFQLGCTICNPCRQEAMRRERLKKEGEQSQHVEKPSNPLS
jgi:hypothetical protein